MSDLLQKSKKELVEIISQMSAKLTQVKDAEKKMDLEETDLKGKAFSVLKDESDKFHLVEVAFDSDTGKASVSGKISLDTGDYDIASYQARKYLVQNILSKQQLNHNKGK